MTGPELLGLKPLPSVVFAVGSVMTQGLWLSGGNVLVSLHQWTQRPRCWVGRANNLGIGKSACNRKPKDQCFNHIKVYFFSHIKKCGGQQLGLASPALLGPQKTNFHPLGSTILREWLSHPMPPEHEERWEEKRRGPKLGQLRLGGE